MKPSFKDYFHFNRSERKGIISLVLLIALVLIIKESLIYFQPNPFTAKLTNDSLLLAIEKAKVRMDSVEQQSSSDLPNYYSEKKNKQLSKAIFEPFNPNNAKIEDWQKMGLSEKQAQVIKNYQVKAGKFESKADVKKMFVISDELYQKMEPFIQLPDQVENKKEHYSKKETYKTYKPKPLPKVEINSASAEEFRALYGIGPTLSKRIVENREKLGGFYSKEQLRHIYGLKDSVLLRLDTQLLVQAIPLKKININSVEYEELKKHPYFYWKTAQALTKYREQHGNYRTVEEIKNSYLISDSLFQLVKPYLSVSP